MMGLTPSQIRVRRKLQRRAARGLEPANDIPEISGKAMKAASNGNAVELPHDEMVRLRAELFEKGSSFLPTSKDEIIGIDNVLMEIDEVIHWLRHAPLYQRFKSRLEPGILFEGEPGTGKTLVSRYIASASDALFVSVRDWPHNGPILSDSDIAALFQGARDTYAKNHKPIVLFWDEFEGNAMERAHTTLDQASSVAQLTAELDGVHGKNEGILLIGCTNYFCSIDHALLRPGRMGLQIEFHAPDREGKAALLEYYLAKGKTLGDIDIDTLSYLFNTDATAAEIEESCMEAWRYAVRRSIEEMQDSEEDLDPGLSQADLMKVFVKRLVGPPTSFMNLTTENRRSVALHEAGHALTALIYDVPVRLITVQPGKNSLGRVLTAEVEEHVGSQNDLLNELRVCLGACAAERVARLNPTMAGSSDLRHANEMATRLIDVLNYGRQTRLFSPMALADARSCESHSGEGMSPSISEEAIQRSDREIDALLNKLESEVSLTMKEVGYQGLWSIAETMNDRVTLTGAEFRAMAADILGTNDFAKFRSHV